MEYRFLGKSGIKVSVLGFGNWVNCHVDTPENEQTCLQCMEQGFKLGINYFDTAERYGFGTGEKILGRCFKKLGWARKDFVLSTKLFEIGPNPNDKMMSRKHIIEGLNASLERMGMEYVDIVFSHRYDNYTPMEEVCRAFNSVIEHGKAFYWGTSMWDPEQIMEAMECCERFDLIKPIVEQPEYNLLVRKNVEVDLCSLYDKHGMGTTVFSPLAGGYLTGKYINSVPEGSRYKEKIPKFLPGFVGVLDKKYAPKDNSDKIKKFMDYSKQLNFTPSQVALAWVLKDKDVSTCILGASDVKQLVENFGALDAMKIWSPKIEKDIEDIFGNMPEPKMDYRNWTHQTPRRELSVQFK